MVNDTRVDLDELESLYTQATAVVDPERYDNNVVLMAYTSHKITEATYTLIQTIPALISELRSFRTTRCLAQHDGSAYDPDIEAYRFAPSGMGCHASTWDDKPHRIVYELCRLAQNERDRANQKEKL